jgi:N6-adenosine-specific RNA methylase IME4
VPWSSSPRQNLPLSWVRAVAAYLKSTEIDKLIPSVQSIHKSKVHSAKPAEFRAIIDRLYPSGERLELFARGDVPPPWRTWGAEVESD